MRKENCASDIKSLKLRKNCEDDFVDDCDLGADSIYRVLETQIFVRNRNANADEIDL